MSLLVAIHDVAPPHLETVQRLRAQLEDWGVARATLLAVPDYHGRGRLARSPATAAWLRARADAGDEVCLHGHYHEQRRRIRRVTDRVRARVWTAGEGECLAQGAYARELMLHDEKRALEDLLGRPVVGFVAPAWLEPRGFALPLAQAGFSWHEGGTWVERLGAARRVYRGPVVGFATRTTARRLTSLAWSRVAAELALGAARLGVAPARVALHPADLTSPTLVSAAGSIIRRLARHLDVATYVTGLGIANSARAAPNLPTA
jgi:predicted deacetylase